MSSKADENRGGSTYERILAVAMTSFSAIGYAETSMRTIARDVGIQPAALYNHFPSKKDLLWSLVYRAMDDLGAAQRRAQIVVAGEPAEVRLRAFVRAHVRWHALNPEYTRIGNELASLSHSHFRTASAFRRKYRREFEVIVGEVLETMPGRRPDTRVVSVALLQVCGGVAYWYRRDGKMTVDELCDEYELIAARVLGLDSADRETTRR